MIIWRNFFKASPQPSPWEREYRYSCLLISYNTNLAPSPTERVGERLQKGNSNGNANTITIPIITCSGNPTFI